MIIYLHGFSSAATSSKAVKLKNSLGGLLADNSFHIPAYTSHQPDTAIRELDQYIIALRESANFNGKIMLIGSSLGAYYGQYLAKTTNEVCALVMINPALQPHLTLKPYIGHHTNMVNGQAFVFRDTDFSQLPRYQVNAQEMCKPVLVLLDKGDEIIDYRFAQAQYRKTAKVICYDGGDHWFRHLEEAIPDISDFYTRYCDV